MGRNYFLSMDKIVISDSECSPEPKQTGNPENNNDDTVCSFLNTGLTGDGINSPVEDKQHLLNSNVEVTISVKQNCENKSKLDEKGSPEKNEICHITKVDSGLVDLEKARADICVKKQMFSLEQNLPKTCIADNVVMDQHTTQNIRQDYTQTTQTRDDQVNDCTKEDLDSEFDFDLHVPQVAESKNITAITTVVGMSDFDTTTTIAVCAAETGMTTAVHKESLSSVTQDSQVSDSIKIAGHVTESNEEREMACVQPLEEPLKEDSDSEFEFELPQCADSKTAATVTTISTTSVTSIVADTTQTTQAQQSEELLSTGTREGEATFCVQPLEEPLKEDSDSEFEFELPQCADSKTAATISTTSVTSIVADTTQTTQAQRSEELLSTGTREGEATFVIPEETVAGMIINGPEMSDKQLKALQLAEAEWENVHTIEPTMGHVATVVTSSQLISVQELLENFQVADYSSVLPNVHMSVNRRGFAALKHFLMGPPKLHRNLLQQKQLIFCIAASPFENNNPVHKQILQTIYRCVTASKFDVGRYGGHWEDIGFQGNDPSTDLRAVGLLGLLNLVHLLQHPKNQVLARDIYKLSQDSTQNFPFCVMGINMSRIVLQALRKDCLNKECNRRLEVIGVVNELYVALYLRMYQIWKRQGKTIKDSGFVIKDLEHAVEKDPRDLLQNLDEFYKKKVIRNVDLPDSSTEPGKFVSVCDDTSPT